MDKEKLATQRIQMASKLSLQHYGVPLEVEYSGGKDSDVLVELFKRSGEPFEVAHSLTTVDAPETVRHIQENFRRWEGEGIKCIVDKHEYMENGKKKRITMWNLIPKKKMPPTRIARYCCAVLKETRGGGNGLLQPEYERLKADKEQCGIHMKLLEHQKRTL